MAREYYYLIAGLPDLFLDQDRKDFSLTKLREEMRENMHPNDFKLVELLFLEYDNQNFQNFFFARKLEFSPLGNYPQELYSEFEDNLSLFPDYIQKFYYSQKQKGNSTETDDNLPFYEGEKVEKNPEVQFQEYFYQFVTSTKNCFLSQWFAFLRDFNNILTAISCRKFGVDASAQMVGEGELVEILSRSQASDFGIKREVEYLEQLLQVADLSDIIERERRLDLLKWSKVDEITTFDYFNVNKILAFLVKAGIVQRWIKLDAQVGAEMFKRLVSDLRGTYQLPKEFAK